jgi:hypothetical protein
MKKCETCIHGSEPFCTWRNILTTPPSCRVIYDDLALQDVPV